MKPERWETPDNRGTMEQHHRQGMKHGLDDALGAWKGSVMPGMRICMPKYPSGALDTAGLKTLSQGLKVIGGGEG